jgi:hypothetical protein
VLFPSAGQFVDTPSQVSAMSQTPPAARQTLPALPAGCVQTPAPLQTSRVQALLSVAQALLFASN